jgi:predicted nucleic acid-binding protein
MDTLDMATNGVIGHKLSFWDAMIWAVAEQHGLEEILTEDGPIGSTIGHVTFTNPFSS